MSERRRRGYPLRVNCAGEGCKRTAYSAPKYRHIAVGWYFDRDGTALCPDHLPDELATFMGARFTSAGEPIMGDVDYGGWPES